MFVEVKSILSDDVRSKEIDVQLRQVRAWKNGALIQDAMPNVSPEDRDFFKGIFWDELEYIDSSSWKTIIQTSKTRQGLEG